MCLMLYLISNTPLRDPKQDSGITVTPVRRRPGWASKALPGGSMATVTVDTCSCGFISDDPTDPSPAIARKALATYLRSSLRDTAHLWLYAIWLGDERRPIASIRDLIPEDLLTNQPSFGDSSGSPRAYRVISSSDPN